MAGVQKIIIFVSRGGTIGNNVFLKDFKNKIFIGQ